MEQSLLFSWVPQVLQNGVLQLGTEFVFVDPFDPSEVDPGDLSHVIPSSETAGDGEYQSDSHLAARLLTMKGTLVGDTLGDVQTRLNTLLAAHPKGGAGRFRQRLVDPVAGVVSDYFLTCRVYNRKPDPQNGFPFRAWQITYRAASPLWQEWTARSQVLINQSTSGLRTVAFAPGGGESVLPVFSVVVTVPGIITITPGETVGMDSSVLVSFAAPVADTWTVDNEKRVLTRAGAPGVNQNERIVTGGFFALPPTTQTLTFTASSGATFTSATAVWRQRFPTI